MAEGITLKRIIDMDEAAELTSSDYALVDSATGGPKKFALGEELSSLKEEFSELFIPLPVDVTYSGKLVRLTGLADNASFDSYRFVIPDNVESVRVKTAFYGQVYVIVTDQDSDATFNAYPFLQFPDEGYPDPTVVDTVIATNGFKYIYVPHYRASNAEVSVSVAYKTIIDDKVDKNGTRQVTERNTTFLLPKDSNNLVSLDNKTVIETPLTISIDENHVATTISSDLTARVMPIFGDLVLKPGTYTLSIYADEDYANLGGGAYIGLYTGENKNVLFQYVYCSYASGTSKTFTVETDTIVYFRFRTQDIAECNANYSNFGSIGFRIMLASGNVALPWVSPNPTYKLIWPAEESLDCANISMFEKIGVIGDSYASGQVYLSGSPVNYYNLSWGQVLARRIGATCVNLSSGGLTTRTWLSAEKGLPLLQSSEAQGLYIIVLGINDYTEISAGRYNLGTESDFDLTNYSATPDTFYGNMCKIIGNIIAKSPNAKIILSTMAKNENTLQKSINAAIIRCAELAEVVSIKQFEDSFFSSAYYVNGMVSGHPTAPVYSGMAKAIGRLIDKCMNDNYAYFSSFVWTN